MLIMVDGEPIEPTELRRRYKEVQVERDAALAEAARYRESNRRLNERCQRCESALAAPIEAMRREGVSLGRALANAAASKYEAERDAVINLCIHEIPPLDPRRPRYTHWSFEGVAGDEDDDGDLTEWDTLWVAQDSRDAAVAAVRRAAGLGTGNGEGQVSDD